MKKLRVVLSGIAFASAIVFAFAFKPMDGNQPAFVNSSGQCQPTVSPCPGDGNDCIVDIPEDGVATAIQLKEYQSGTTCGRDLEME